MSSSTVLKDRGMRWDVEELARRWLSTVGYYRLSAYWLPMEEAPESGAVRSKVFIDGARFEKVIDTYVFDRKLRLLVMEALERVEISVRSRWTNRLSLEGGAHAHLTLNLFNSSQKQIPYIQELHESFTKSAEEFVKHYRNKYKSPDLPPLWVCTELMTMGQLSRWVDSTQDTTLKKKLAQDIGLPSAGTLSGALHALSFVRNVCAHHHRLWNRRFVKRMPFIREFESDMLCEELKEGEKKSNVPDNRIYNCLVVLIKLLKHQSMDTTFPHRLCEIIATRSDDERTAMGVPSDWRSRSLWEDICVVNVSEDRDKVSKGKVVGPENI